jgi:hypothetical protein
MSYAITLTVTMVVGILIGYGAKTYEGLPIRPELVKDDKLTEQDELDAMDTFVHQLWDSTLDDVRLKVWRHKWPKDKKPAAITDHEIERAAIASRPHDSIQRERIVLGLRQARMEMIAAQATRKGLAPPR